MGDFLTVLGEYDVIAAYWVNIRLTLLAGLFALLIGTVLAMFRISPIPSLRLTGTAYVNIVRNTPLTIIIVFGIAVLWPVLGLQFSETFDINFFWLAVVGLTVYHAAFVCEALRSGVNTVPQGQAEAARAIGLPFMASARLVILPQAFRGAIAPLGNVLIALIKNTTVAATGSVAEVSLLMKEMVENESNYVYPIFLTIAVGFVIIVIPVGLLATYLSKRLAVAR
ncbi:MAG: amino acid ABC transporter permease [Beutenbergiaceae bacterium]